MWKNLSTRVLAAGLSACVCWGCAAGAMAAPSRALYDITPLERPEVEGLTGHNREDLFTIRPDLAARLFYETMPSEAPKGKGSRDDK